MSIIWQDFIKQEQEKDYYKSLMEFVKKESENYQVFPNREDLFNAFKHTPYEEVKVLILAQDPYHNTSNLEGPTDHYMYSEAHAQKIPQAHGLAFSVPPGIAIPPSLKNIFKELKDDLSIPTPTHGCLDHWSKQGVFLLNSILTVRAHTPASHKDRGWETFTDEAIKKINEKTSPVVFILLGNFAKEKKTLITNKHHLILQASHPSPYSANSGFFGSKVFSKTNAFLTKNNLSPIDWSI